MHSVSIEQILNNLLVECYKRRNLCFVLFAVISLSLLTVGVMWPKKYTSFAIIHINDTTILQPLMRGAAEATKPTDHVANAKEIIFGEKIMQQLLHDTGWMESNPTDVEQERIKSGIKSSLNVWGMGKTLLRIEYTDEDQLRAYTTSKRLAELFIEVGENSKVEESLSAYNFINSQVEVYLEKLLKIESELRLFRSNNPDARPGLQQEVSNHISKLQKDIEATRLQLRELNIKKDSIKQQLSGEAAITISQSKEGRIREQMSDLQTQLELLRLDYKETYPDIVRLKAQIEDLKVSLIHERSNREIVKAQAKESGRTYVDEALMLSPLYQELRSGLSATETEIATLTARISVLIKTLNTEYERAKKIYSGEETLSQLTRNYKVNQDIYQDLLKRLENARVSKNLDEKQKGYTFKIQEPAKIPLIPTGIRFLHFALAGIAAGLFLPIGFVYGLLIIDPRVRYSHLISYELDVPVLAEVNETLTNEDYRKTKNNIALLSVGFVVVIFIYAYVSWMKMTGQI